MKRTLPLLGLVGVAVLAGSIAAGASSARTGLEPAGATPGGLAEQTFTIFIYEPASELARRTDAGPDGRAYWGAYMAYAAELEAAGLMRPGGCCLRPDEDAVVVSTRAGRVARTDGAHAVSPDGHRLGGYFVIGGSDLDEAVSWAARAPAARNAVVEVRPSYPMPVSRSRP